MTAEEKSLARLEAQYEAIMGQIAELKKTIPDIIAAAITKHTLSCINQRRDKTSYPPGFFQGIDPRIRARLVNTIIAVLSTGGTILAMRFGLGG